MQVDFHETVGRVKIHLHITNRDEIHSQTKHVRCIIYLSYMQLELPCDCAYIRSFVLSGAALSCLVKGDVFSFFFFRNTYCIRIHVHTLFSQNVLFLGRKSGRFRIYPIFRVAWSGAELSCKSRRIFVSASFEILIV